MSLTFKPHATQFSLNNAHSLALAAQLAYKEAAHIRTTLAPQFIVEFIEDLKTDTQCFIAHNAEHIVLAFCGTTELRDWLTNAQFDFQSTLHGRVHQGFHRALDSVWPKITQTLTNVQQNAQALWLTGHSLGGALAVLAAARLCLDLDQDIYKSVYGLYTFGQPRVGDRTFVNTLDAELKDRYFRFVNDNDIVTRVPIRLNQYQQSGTVCFFDAQGLLHRDVSHWFAFLERLKGGIHQKMNMVPSFIEHHAIARYLNNIEYNQAI